MKFEGGPHRVQRVPVTESQGRIHTSSATVTVLPEADEVDVDIDPNDLQIDVYRSSGPGGQSVNTTDSAVRITHKPTGIVVAMQDERSQLQNRARAMQVLRARLLKAEQDRQAAEVAAERKAQVGGGGRSEKIRTYNFKENRVTDHRIGLTLYRLQDVLAGDLDEMRRRAAGRRAGPPARPATRERREPTAGVARRSGSRRPRQLGGTPADEARWLCQEASGRDGAEWLDGPRRPATQRAVAAPRRHGRAAPSRRAPAVRARLVGLPRASTSWSTAGC